jgi:hypothetical protein
MHTADVAAAESYRSVSVAGVGACLPDQRVSNRDVLEWVHPCHPDGTPFASDWIERHVGIHERRMDFDFAHRRKPSRSEGGLFDGDLAVRAARAALKDARMDAADVDVLVHVSTTPDTPACGDHLTCASSRPSCGFVAAPTWCTTTSDARGSPRGCELPRVPALVVGGQRASRREQLSLGLLLGRGHRLLRLASERLRLAVPARLQRRRRSGRAAILRPPVGFRSLWAPRGAIRDQPRHPPRYV